MSSVSVQEAARWMRDRDGFLILTHRRPDGDTLGCAAGLCQALRELGKTCFLHPNEDVNERFAPYLEGTFAPKGFEPACVISVDIAAEGLFPASAERYKGKIDLAIDHHPSNEGFARMNCVEADKAACGEIVFDLICQWGAVSAAAALPLYLAVSTDTGCFVYSNTTANTHRVAAALMETGIPFQRVNKRHFRTKSFRRLQIEGRMLETMEFYDEGQTALACVTLADLEQYGASETDLDDISAFAGQVEGVHTAVTIREVSPGECKVSVRTQADVNANRVCALLGGGGHAAAAGCSVNGSVEETKKAVLDAIRKVKEGKGVMKPCQQA